jgi:hypothetical protein
MFAGEEAQAGGCPNKHLVQYSPWSNKPIQAAGRVSFSSASAANASSSHDSGSGGGNGNGGSSGGNGGSGNGGGWGYWADRHGKPGWIFNGTFPVATSSSGGGSGGGGGKGKVVAMNDAPVLSFPVPAFGAIHRTPRVTLGYTRSYGCWGKVRDEVGDVGDVFVPWPLARRASPLGSQPELSSAHFPCGALI